MLGIFTGLTAFIASTGLLLLALPRKETGQFWRVGLVGGFGTALLLTYLMSNIFGFWKFVAGDIILGGIPLFLAATWLPLVIMYCYFVSKSREILHLILATAGFAALATAAHWYFIRTDILIYSGWSLLYTFILAAVIHTAVLYYLYATKQLAGLASA